MQSLLRSRELSEQQASSSKSTHNRLRAGSLAELLHDYRSDRSPARLQATADKYNVDKAVLERLVSVINNPSHNQGSVERTVGEDGQERITTLVRSVQCRISMHWFTVLSQAIWSEGLHSSGYQSTRQSVP